jgi:hypothetical protein
MRRQLVVARCRACGKSSHGVHRLRFEVRRKRAPPVGDARFCSV